MRRNVKLMQDEIERILIYGKGFVGVSNDVYGGGK